MLKDTQAEREQIVKDFANRVKGIIEEAMKWAPDTMKSHMKEYINNKGTEGTSTHSGLALATECVLSFASLNSTSDSLPQPYLATRPNCVKNDTSRFFSSLSQRKEYSGKVSGMLDLADDDDDPIHGRERLTDKLIKNVTMAAEDVKSLSEGSERLVQALEKFHDSIWKVTGIIVSLYNDRKPVPRRLWFTIASAPVKLFRAEAMADIVECWHWLLSACPEMEMVFLQEMVAAWHFTRASRCVTRFYVEPVLHLSPSDSASSLWTAQRWETLSLPQRRWSCSLVLPTLSLTIFGSSSCRRGSR